MLPPDALTRVSEEELAKYHSMSGEPRVDKMSGEPRVESRE
jgi:hypothetical protein